MKNFQFSIFNFQSQKGQSLVELLLVIGLSAIILPALLTGLVASREGKAQHGQRTNAVAVLKTTVEAVRSVREKGWSSLPASGATYHPEVSGSSWTLIAGEDAPVTGFKRQVVISDALRDINGVIVASGGTADPSTKKIVVTVSWETPYHSSITSTLYLTRYLGNNSQVQTTQAQFNLGTNSGTSVNNSYDGINHSNDGAVTLVPTGKGDWCRPADKPIKELDLPKSGVANALTAIEGRAFAGTGNNASGGTFENITWDSSSATPIPTIAGTYDPANPPQIKTNGVFGEPNFAYITTDNNSKEVIMISLTQYTDPPTNSKYKEVGSINLPGNVNGNSIYVVNNKAYVTSSDKKFYIYSLSADRTSATLQNSPGLTLTDQGNKVLVTGNYAFVATAATTNNFQIICFDSSCNPTASLSNPKIVGQLTLGVGQAGVDVYVDTSTPAPSRAYFVTAILSGKPDFFIIDISNPASPSPIVGAVYDTYTTKGMTPKGVTVVNNLGKPIAAIIVGAGSNRYQVLNIQGVNESNPFYCGGMNTNTDINGVSSVLQSNGDAYSYIITKDASAEFKIIVGGPGGSFGTLGDFTSYGFNASSQTAFDRFDVSVIKPANTDIKFQVATSNPVGTCDGGTYTFVGPDGTSSTYFQTLVNDALTSYSYVVPLSLSPKQCFKYKAYLSTSNISAAPTLYDVTLYYAP